MQKPQKHIQHLYLRAGFGIMPSELKAKLSKTKNAIVKDVFAASKVNQPLLYISDPVKGKEVGNLRILLMILSSQKHMEELDVQWLNKMAQSPATLREKMTLFWHNHFATSTQFAWLMQIQNNTLRTHALDSFRTLLHAVAKDPAMIIYLNNQQNKKDAPNENFAREVMELFTLGEGNIYSEKDIKESARAFTGWTVNKKGEFEFSEEDHDTGTKEFLGKIGNFKGEDIINVLLEQKQTAHHITQKIYKHFVNPEVDIERVKILAENFYASDYNISLLMEEIFLSDWFYDEKNIGCIIASPVELIVRYKKLVAFNFKNEKEMVRLQKVLGQVLFFPPNVAGWPGDRQWIDSTTLPLRLQMPAIIMQKSAFVLQAKPELESTAEESNTVINGKRDKVHSNWNALTQSFSDNKTNSVTDALIDYLIQCDNSRIDKNAIAQFAGHQNPYTDYAIIRTATYIMSLPEFQLI